MIQDFFKSLVRGASRKPLSARRRLTLAAEELETRVTPALLVATSFFDSSVYEFDANTGALAATLVQPYTSPLLQGASGLTLGPDGNFYLSSQFSDSILQYNTSTNTLSTFIGYDVLHPIGAEVGTAAGVGPTNFSPAALRFGPDGNLYASLYAGLGVAAGGVVRFDINTDSGGNLSYDSTNPDNATVIASTGIEQAEGLTFGPAGDSTTIYVSSAGNDTIAKITNATGASPSTSTFITGGADTGNLNYPSGLTWGPDGKLYVTDLAATSYQGNVLRFNTDGTFDGIYAQPDGMGNGSLLFAFPSDLAFDAQGRLDTANLGPYYPGSLAGSIYRYDANGNFDTYLVTSAQFPVTGPGTSGISPSQLVYLPTGTVTTLADNGPNPSSPDQAATFTVTVYGGTTISGQTVWIEDADDANAVVASPTLDSNGAVTFTISDLSVGTHKLFAVYGGDANNDASNSSTSPITHVVNPTADAPAVASVVVNGGYGLVPNAEYYIDGQGYTFDLSGQNSVVVSLLVTFSEAVALDPGAFTVTPESTTNTQGTPGSVYVVSGNQPNQLPVEVNAPVPVGGGSIASQWVLTFSGAGTTPIGEAGGFEGVGNILKDGVYNFSMDGSKVHANALTAANSSSVFWALYGANSLFQSNGTNGSNGANGGTLSPSLGDGTSELFLDPIDVVERNSHFLADSSNLYTPPSYDPAMDSDLSGFYDGFDVGRFNANYLTDWTF